MHKVHSQLSPEAVVLEWRQLEQGVEVLAAVDYDLALAAQIRHCSGAKTLDAQSPAGLFNPAVELPSVPLAAAIHEQAAEILALRREVAGLRTMLEEQVASLAGFGAAAFPPHLERVSLLFARLGVDAVLTRELLEELPATMSAEAIEDYALREFAWRILVLPADILEAESKQQQVIVLLGPDGGGKTTTISKLAARHIARHGEGSLALISSGSHRHDSELRLRNFASAAGLILHRAADAASLQELLLQLADCSLVLIDAAGGHARDWMLAGQRVQFGALGGQMRCFLVLAANEQFDAYSKIISRFRAVPLAGVILTKLDETAKLGAVLSALIRHELGVAAVCNGQRMLDDLHHMGADELLDRALALSRSHDGAGRNLARRAHEANIGDSGHVPV